MKKSSACLYALCLSTLIFAFGCGGDTNSANTGEATGALSGIDGLAAEICRCAQETMDLNQQMQQLQEEGKREEFTKMAGQVSQTFQKAINCSREASAKAQLANLDKTRLKNSIKERCPDIPDKLSEELANRTQESTE